MKKTSLLKIAQTAMMTAIIAVLSQISIPISDVPLTLQTFGVALAAYLLGPWYGMASILVYLALGAVGAPVFAGFKGSVASLVGPTGGFLFGFLLMVLLCGLAVGRRKKLIAILLSLAGLALLHILGMLWFAHVLKASLWTAFLTATAPYLLKDILSVLGAWFLAEKLRPHLSAKADS